MVQEPDAQLSIEDISPLLGNLQLTIVTQEKTIKRLRERLAALENTAEPAKLPLDEQADLRKMPVDGKSR